MCKVKKNHQLLSALVFLLLSNSTFSQVKAVESDGVVLKSENYSHDIIIWLLISVIVALQIYVFYNTQKRISFYRKAIDRKENYKTVKIRIPVRWAESWDIEQIMSRKEDIKVVPTNFNRVYEKAETVVYTENDEETDFIPDSEGIKEFEDQSEIPNREHESFDLFSTYEVEVQEDIDNSWVTIQKYDEGRIQTKRVMRKNLERYNQWGWELFN
jgi:hypothetical protein